MEIIVHRINSIKELNILDKNYGVEIDIRAHNSNLILNHEPHSEGENLIDYLEQYDHGTLVLNIKDSGIEETVIKMVKKFENIKSYFLLEVEFPYLYNASMLGEDNIAIRFSEFETIQTVEKFKNKVKWVWIDTFNYLPIKKTDISILKNFKTCLVCPERWNRKNEILDYKKRLKSLNIDINAVMTSKSCIAHWL